MGCHTKANVGPTWAAHCDASPQFPNPGQCRANICMPTAMLAHFSPLKANVGPTFCAAGVTESAPQNDRVNARIRFWVFYEPRLYWFQSIWTMFRSTSDTDTFSVMSISVMSHVLASIAFMSRNWLIAFSVHSDHYLRTLF